MNDSARDQYIPGLHDGEEGVETFAFATHGQGRYEAAWFGWCELCLKWRIRIFWWAGDGMVGDTVCWRCRR